MENGTKLFFFSTLIQINSEWYFSKTLTAISKVHDFYPHLVAPKALVEESFKETYEETKFWSRQKVSVERVARYNYILVFPRELTHEELQLWRAFKIGFFCKN